MTILIPARELPVLTECDVLVCGGGAAGCAAALGAARHDADVLLTERFGYLGGATVTQWVFHILSTNCVDFQGVWHDWMRAVGARGGVVDYGIMCQNGNNYLYRSGVDPEVVKYAWDDMLAAAGVRLLHHAWCVNALIEDGVIVGVVIESRAGRQVILAKRVIDATGDGIVCDAAGVPWEQGDGVHPYNQAMTKIYRLGNAQRPESYTPQQREDLQKKLAASNAKDEFDSPVVRNGRAIQYAVSGAFKSCPSYRRELNAVASRVLEVNPVDPFDFTRAEREGREQARQCAAFAKKYIPGYEDSYLLGTSEHIGLRDSRRIHGVQTVTDDDAVLFRKRPADGIARSSWDIDIWPGDSYDNPAVPRHTEAYKKRIDALRTGEYFDIPYGCIVAAGIENLFVAGRCISAERQAQASLRIQQTCQSLGEAAGVAAAMSLDAGTLARDVAVDRLRRQLETDRDVEPAFETVNNVPIATET